MPRVFKLTWDKSLNRWVKVIRGRRYYFGKGQNKSHLEDYRAALAEYQRLLPEILAGRLVGQPSGRSPSSSPARQSRDPKKRLTHAVTEYHRQLDTRADAPKQEGGISKGRAVGVKGWLKPFIEFMAAEYPTRGVDGIDEDVISKYEQVQRRLRKEEDISPHTLFQRFAILKHFLRFCWTRRLLKELPRNLSELKASIPANDDPRFFDWRTRKGSEVQRLIAACRRDDFLYLCVLLGLNCGLTLKDINDLKACEFRWQSRTWKRIERDRSKSGQYGNFILWDETERMLMKFRSTTADYNSNDALLLQPNGQPIMDLEGGQFDSPIAYKFKKIVREVFGNEDERSFKSLRKTGANYCARREFGTEVLHLAHKPRTMAARFYAKTPVDRLDRILCWMEEDFGLVETLVKRYRTTDEQERSRREMDDQVDDD
jgi:hypothetical protein